MNFNSETLYDFVVVIFVTMVAAPFTCHEHKQGRL